MSTEEINNLEDVVDKELQKVISLSEKAQKEKNKDVLKMIDYYIGLTNEVESRRNKINDTTIQFLMVFITITGIVILIKKDLGEWFDFLIVLLVSQIVLSLTLAITYEVQSRYRYPFLDLDKYGNQWKWFYYGNRYISKINSRTFFRSKKFEDTNKPYLKGLKLFTRRYASETLENEIKDNLLQLYLLQVHNYFKNRFYLQLANIRWVSFGIGFIIIVVAFFWLEVF